MNRSKYRVKFWLLGLLFLFHSTFVFPGALKMPMNSLDHAIQEGSLSLRIYYMPMYILTLIPVDIETMKSDYYYKIDVAEEALRSYHSKIRELDQYKNIKPEKSNTTLNLRIYFELYNSSGKEIIYSIGLGLPDDNPIINGKTYIPNQNLYNLIIDFIPAKEFANYKNTIEEITEK